MTLHLCRLELVSLAPFSIHTMHTTEMRHELVAHPHRFRAVVTKSNCIMKLCCRQTCCEMRFARAIRLRRFAPASALVEFRECDGTAFKEQSISVTFLLVPSLGFHSNFFTATVV